MTAHVVSFTPAGAPTRAVCSCGIAAKSDEIRGLIYFAEEHAHFHGGTVEFAGLPPVEVTA